MSIAIEPGKYILAVSGGVDSMVLLDLLRQRSDLEIVVAHLDHGIREDSWTDRQLVQSVASQHGLTFVYDEAKLGNEASEAKAREVRYDFLHWARDAHNARGVITAHHQDDLLETVVLNLLRGTDRKGMSSLRSSDIVVRPLLAHSKQSIIKYATQNQLEWREDSTNQDTTYLRNYIRHKVLPRIDEASRQKLLEIISNMHDVNDELDAQLINHLHLHPALHKLHRHSFIMLPHRVAAEVMAAWLRRHGVGDFDRKTIERLVRAAKTYAVGQKADVGRGHRLFITKNNLVLR